MMLQTYTSMEIGQGATPTYETLRNPLQAQPISSQCKPQNLNSHFNSRVFLGFNLHTTKHPFAQRQICKSQPTSEINHPLHRNVKILQPQNQKPQKDRGFVGFKLQCHSKAEALPSRTVINGKRKGYGGILPSILRSLRTESDVEKTLDLYYGKLSPKEQTVILKEQSNWEKALRVFAWMKSQKDYVPNVIHYNVILRALGRAKKWDELRLCWIEMAKNSVFPTNNTYAMLVDVYGKAGLVKEALLWIKHMKLRGIFPDEVTMNTVVKVLKDAGEYDRADRFYKDWCIGKIELDDLELDSMDDSEPFSLKQFLLTELFRTGGRNPSRFLSLSEVENTCKKPRMTATYNTLIDLYGKAGRLKDAANVFNEMLKSGVALDAITFNTMIFICGSHGHLEEAEALLNKMEERGISPDTKTYNIFLSLYANAGKIDRAIEWYRKIRGAGLFPDAVTCRAILQILCKQNMIQEVEGVISEIESLGMYIDEHSLPVIMRMYINEGLIDRAKVLFDKCQLNGGFSSPAYAAIIDAYADKGLWTEAEDVFFGRRDKKFIPKKEVVEYNVMIKAYGIAKLYDKAFSLFKGMKSQGAWPDQCTYNSLIQMFSGGDLVDQARELLAEMQGLRFKPSCSTFSALIASYVRMNRISDAVGVFDEMSKAGVKPNEVVYGTLIDGVAEAGKFEEAMRYFHVMKDSGLQANQIILTSMIKAYGKLGSVEGAKTLYEQIKNLQGGPDIIASNSMLNLYADFGMVSEAKLIFNYLRERGQADGVTFATLIYAYKNMGMLDEAIEIAEDMKQSGLLRDCVTFNKVMACYATNGQLVECAELLHEMINRKLLPDGGTFKVLFTILKKGGFSAEAVRQLELSYREGKPYARQAVIIAVFSAVGLHALAIESCNVITQPGLELHPFAYNVAIYAYGASEQIDKALKIFMRMQDEGLEPDIVTFVNLVGCYGKAGMVEGIKRIYGQLKYGLIEPNESLYEAIIDAYGNAGRFDLADLVSQEMKLNLDVKQPTGSESEDAEDEDFQGGEGEDSEG
uniref:Pentatricopeptide repeat-containing protein At1g73710-like n=1 Tax=Nicotiana tabacum TaxID=4097 RepID=A0A1S4BV55_TOBAC|nr:PREDICTED: pentatricopeptide repeat-containing protein At1g73710-like [Nicotiana tabacum]